MVRLCQCVYGEGTVDRGGKISSSRDRIGAYYWLKERGWRWGKKHTVKYSYFVQYLPESKIRSFSLACSDRPSALYPSPSALRPPARLSYRQIHPPIVPHSTLNPSLVRVCRANIELCPNSLQAFLVPFYKSVAIARTSVLLSITSDKPRCCDVGRAGCL